MYLTNHQLVKHFSQGEPNHMVPLLEVTYKLLLRFGKKIKEDSFLSTIQKDHAEIASLVQLLHKVNKLRTSDIMSLINIMKKDPKYTPRFTVYSTNENKDLAKQITDTTKGEVTHNTVEKVGIRVEGEGQYYDRSLDKDLGVLLR